MSNTYFFEKHLCWRGIAVEPTKVEYPKLEKNRPGSTTVSAAYSTQLIRSFYAQHMLCRTSSDAVTGLRCCLHRTARRQCHACAQVHGAICEKEGSKTFTDVTLNNLWTGWSGFKETWDDRHAKQVEAPPGILSCYLTFPHGNGCLCLSLNPMRCKLCFVTGFVGEA